MPRTTVVTRLGIIGALFVLVLVLHATKILTPLEDKIVSVFKGPLEQNQNFSISLRDQYRFFSNRSEFIASASQCFDSLTDNAERDTELQKIAAENEQLRGLLKFKERQKGIPLIATVISKDIASGQQILIVDKGEAEGVKVGDPVVIRNGIFIGTIVKSNNTTAALRLVNDNQSKVAVTLLNKDQSIGVLEGGFGISLKIRFIPRNETINVGDKIITSGLETTIPNGLPIGTVSVVENEAYQPFQEAVVTPFTDLSKITIVGIITNPE